MVRVRQRRAFALSSLVVFTLTTGPIATVASNFEGVGRGHDRIATTMENEGVGEESLILGFFSFDAHLSSSQEVWDEWAMPHASRRMQDKALVLQYITHAAAGGDSEAQYRLGLAYRDGVRVHKKNLERSVGWLSKAARQRHPRASFLFAVALAQGVGTKVPDHTQALHHFLRCAKHSGKHPHHHYHHTDHTLSAALKAGGDLVEAVEEAGHAAAEAGWLLLSEVKAEAREAFRLVTQAAAAHKERALSASPLKGGGGNEEWSLALSAAHNVRVLWAWQAHGRILSGSSMSVSSGGVDGSGTTFSVHQRATAAAKEAKRKMMATTKRGGGGGNEDGQDGDDDEPAAVAVARKRKRAAAEEAQEVAAMRSGAMFQLGDCWEHGRFGTHRDITTAMAWYESAAELDHQEARYRLENLRTQEL